LLYHFIMIRGSREQTRYRFNEFPAGRQEASSPLQKAVSRGLSGAICGIFFSQTTKIFMPN